MSTLHPTASPGQLVAFRGRTWIVLPSESSELLVFRPLGGSEEEITGIFAPLQMPGDEIAPTTLAPPDEGHLGDFKSAKLLFDAARLSFRNASGPFRCMGKLSFRPRAYQVVPLVMALKQDTVRLLIADDVGVGKTVEALMILKELLERGELRRFAVLCLPHLCEQWQRELKDKLDIDAEIIRNSTIASLDRRLPNDDRSVYHHLPAQVISIDFVKSDRRRATFLQDCPELVIVDEAHACALPAGSNNRSSQQRYHLLHDIAKRPRQHLLLLTATPHSGKDEEFQSLLGLLDKEFEGYTLEGLDEAKRRKIARHFIQRKRSSIERWHRNSGGEEKTPFPKREAKEHPYKLSPAYLHLYERVLRFARGMTQGERGERQQRIRFWAALALLRGVMSSPATALEMLRNRQHVPEDEDVAAVAGQPRLVSDGLEVGHDHSEADLLDFAALDKGEFESLRRLSKDAEALLGPEQDWKLLRLVESMKALLREGYSPIVFCRFIATAKYVGAQLRAAMPEGVHVQVVSSELADEQRREVIDRMAAHPRRLLVATDCLSEGINLQASFDAVVHYDLPWNPNRLEQREGRVDRFGQERAVVKTVLLIGEDNPIDRTVFSILVKKVMEIQRAIGVQIQIGENSASIMDAVIKDIFLGREGGAGAGQQLSMFAETAIQSELDTARRKAENLRNIFSHEGVSKEEIEAQLGEVDEAIGDAATVQRFVCEAVQHLGGQAHPHGSGWELHLLNLPAHLRDYFDGRTSVKVSFESPTPSGYRYVGRNHRFVEELCQYLIGLAFEPGEGGASSVSRAAVVLTDAVAVKTTLIQFRVRNVIKEVQGKREVIAEEMFLWGYRRVDGETVELGYEEAKSLLLTAVSSQNMSREAQAQRFAMEAASFAAHAPAFQRVAEARARHLVEAHEGYKELVGGKRFEAVQPVLPPDLMGVYVLMPIHHPTQTSTTWNS